MSKQCTQVTNSRRSLTPLNRSIRRLKHFSSLKDIYRTRAEGPSSCHLLGHFEHSVYRRPPPEQTTKGLHRHRRETSHRSRHDADSRRGHCDGCGDPAPLRLRRNPQRILEMISGSLGSAISLHSALVLRSVYGSLRSAI